MNKLLPEILDNHMAQSFSPLPSTCISASMIRLLSTDVSPQCRIGCYTKTNLSKENDSMILYETCDCNTVSFNFIGHS